jgi:hypothetical protein
MRHREHSHRNTAHSLRLRGTAVEVPS